MQVHSRLVAAGLTTFVAALLIFFPFRVAYRWFMPPGVALGGIEGTVWSGHAQQAEAFGIYATNLHWRIHPLDLFTGKLGYAIEAEAPGGFVNADIAVGITGKLLFSNLTAALPLQTFEQLSGMQGLRGKLNARFERIELDDAGLPVAVVGTLEVAGLRAPIINSATIGGYRADFFTQNSGVMASVEDTDGVVDIAGSLQISPDRNYQFIAKVAAKANTPPDLRQQMLFLGTANERGQYELRLEGKL
jgi:general secretion pathway protein N